MKEKKKLDGHLTVADVLRLLEKMPKDALVFSDGCDCIGETMDVDYHASDNTVLMSRTRAAG